ncbi:MAG: hypothetical protein NZ602_01120 [Thermoguttaceae bacterium]|nr:hypothetical protein [Thermoguttaceae bacterium]MDW8036571.1 hypothetical protein [Thermoguttaceae bacterium]
MAAERWPVCQAASPPASFQQLQRRWPNGPFQNPTQFPIAVWLQDPRNAGKYKEIGVTLYVGLWKGPTEQQLAELRRHQMPVICDQNEYALAHLDEKLFVGWLQQDEPDNAQELPGGKGYGPPVPPETVIQRYQEMHRRDPSRPVLLNLGQAVAWDGWHGRGVRTNHPEDYPLYVQGGDIVSFDIYPVVHSKPAVAGKLWYVPRGVQRLRQWAGPDRVVWNCIETTRISNLQVKPTPQQVKAEVWMSLIFGSQGIIYFCHQFKPQFVEAALLADQEMAQAVGKLNRQIHELAPVLWSPERRELVQVSVKPPQVDEEMARLLGPVPVAYTVRLYENKLYLFAVRMQPAEAEVEFRLREPAGASRAEVLGENRSLPIREGTFRDRFGPYEVHLYEIGLPTVSPAPSAISTQAKPKESSEPEPEKLPQPKENKELPPVEFYPEMAYSVGHDGWVFSKEWTDAQRTKAIQGQKEAQAIWQKLAPQYAKLVTAEKARELSRWAQTQMAQYRSVPPLEKTVLEPVALSPDGRRLVLEGTIDTLPTHHRLVTRWLKVYLHYDLPDKKVTSVVFTIRGQLEE